MLLQALPSHPMSDESQQPSSRTIRVDDDLAAMIKIICVHRGRKTVEYASALLRPLITSDYRKLMQELKGSDDEPPQAEPDPEPPPAPPPPTPPPATPRKRKGGKA